MRTEKSRCKGESVAVRKMPSITVPSFSEKSYVLDNFSNVTKTAYNVGCEKNSLKTFTQLRKYKGELPNCEILALLTDGERFYLYGSDGLYVKQGETYRFIKSLETKPSIISFLYKDVKYALFNSSSGNFVLEQNLEERGGFSIPFGECSLVYKNRLYVCNKNQIYFSKFNDLVCFDNSINSDAGVIKINEKFGELQNLFATRDGVLILCDKGISLLKPNYKTEAFKLSTLASNLNLQKGSAIVQNDTLYFINDGELCVCKNNSVSFVSTKTNLSIFKIQEGCGFNDGAYYLSLKDYNDRCFLFTYDVNAKTEKLISIDLPIVSSDGKFVCDNSICEVTRSISETEDFLWESEPIDFGDFSLKQISEIYLDTKFPVELEISNCHSKKVIKFSKDSKLKKFSMCGRFFNLILRGQGLVEIEKIKLKYRIKEE